MGDREREGRGDLYYPLGGMRRSDERRQSGGNLAIEALRWFVTLRFFVCENKITSQLKSVDVCGVR